MNVTEFSEQYDAVWRVWQPASEKGLRRFWEQQAELLNAMQAFTNGWFERRQAETQAALEATQRICGAATPVESLQCYQEWTAGAFERIAADLVAHRNAFSRAASIAAPSLVPSSEDTRGETAPVEESRRAPVEVG